MHVFWECGNTQNCPQDVIVHANGCLSMSDHAIGLLDPADCYKSAGIGSTTSPVRKKTVWKIDAWMLWRVQKGFHTPGSVTDLIRLLKVGKNATSTLSSILDQCCLYRTVIQKNGAFFLRAVWKGLRSKCRPTLADLKFFIWILSTWTFTTRKKKKHMRRTFLFYKMYSVFLKTFFKVYPSETIFEPLQILSSYKERCFSGTRITFRNI